MRCVRMELQRGRGWLWGRSWRDLQRRWRRRGGRRWLRGSSRRMRVVPVDRLRRVWVVRMDLQRRWRRRSGRRWLRGSSRRMRMVPVDRLRRVRVVSVRRKGWAGRGRRRRAWWLRPEVWHVRVVPVGRRKVVVATALAYGRRRRRGAWWLRPKVWRMRVMPVGGRRKVVVPTALGRASWRASGRRRGWGRCRRRRRCRWWAEHAHDGVDHWRRNLLDGHAETSGEVAHRGDGDGHRVGRAHVGVRERRGHVHAAGKHARAGIESRGEGGAQPIVERRAVKARDVSADGENHHDLGAVDAARDEERR